MPSATNVPLKYRFRAIYKDKMVFDQPENDTSKIDPKRSAYFDVDQDNLRQFYVSDFESMAFGIDLETGRFSSSVRDAISTFFVGNPGPKPYKLVFWRQHTHNFNVEYEEQSHVVKYILGYEDADGVEHTILID